MSVWCKQLRRITKSFQFGGASGWSERASPLLTGQLYRSVVGEERLKKIVDDLVDAIGASAAPAQTDPAHPADLWSQRDVALITYGDSIVDGGSKPLKVLRDFCETWLGNCVTGFTFCLSFRGRRMMVFPFSTTHR